MRNNAGEDGVTVNAIAGTHVVTLGLDLTDERRQGCLGFAVQREDHAAGERYWMKGAKTFAATDPGLGPGGQVSSRDHPFQTFQWADYSAKPERAYTYTVVPLFGSPTALSEGRRIPVDVTTEGEGPTPNSPHGAVFNRGSIASQEYARRFQDKKPTELTGSQQAAAYAWLSRGLLEALLAFIERADGPEFGLFGAIYEFQWPAVLAALKAADARGSKVAVLYDDIPGSGPWHANEAAIELAGLDALVLKRTTGKIMHNKFLVLTMNDEPVAVWTGSTNITENGLFGHFNCGHTVEGSSVAGEYLTYWKELCENSDPDTERAWVGTHNPSPPDPWKNDVTVIFSPHTGLAVLDWYANTVAGEAHDALFMTFAFGMDSRFTRVYERDDDVLRFALLDKAGGGRNAQQSKDELERIRRRPNVVVAVGNRIVTNSFDRWLAESSGLGPNVQWVHTKFMLRDPLSSEPVVVTGSANFSEASTEANNENMLVIRGDTRVADIYIGEFMRLYSHYAFREAVARAQAEPAGSADAWEPAHLVPDETWQTDYFTPGTQRERRRRYFARCT